MDQAILVALISGVFGFCGALAALVQGLRVSKQEARNAAEIEQLRSDVNARSQAFEAAREISGPLEAALGDAWREIQTAKDTLAKILAPVSYDLEIAAQQLRNSLNELERGYRKLGSELPDTARRAWHHSRYVLAETLEITMTSIQSQGGAGGISSESASALQERRTTLSDVQGVISAARADLLRETFTRLKTLL